MNATFYLFLGLCLLGTTIRTTYEILKKAGRLDPRNKGIFSVVFAGMILLLTSWIFLGPNDPWRLNLPPGIRWLGLALVAAGFILAFGGMIQLRGLENIDHLVTSGLYSKFRHPMYTGFILWITGWIIYFDAGASLLVGLVCVGNIFFWRHLEEEKMIADYGEEYRTYQTRSWF